MATRWKVTDRLDQHTIGEVEGEERFGLGHSIPLVVQLSDAEHPGFHVTLRITWHRQQDDFVMLRITDLRIHVHRFDYTIPSGAIEDGAWWCELLRVAHDHLMSNARRFDAGAPTADRLTSGWQSGPTYDPRRGRR